MELLKLKSLVNSTTFYKVFNGDLKHYDHTYIPGQINYLNKPFEKTGSCVEGGLYFTTKEHIHKFFNYGDHIRIVKLPIDNKNFEMVQDPDKDKYRSNMIFVCEESYSINNPFTILQLNLMSLFIKHDYKLFSAIDTTKLLSMIKYYKDNDKIVIIADELVKKLMYNALDFLQNDKNKLIVTSKIKEYLIMDESYQYIINKYNIVIVDF